uniref:F-box domain-containing protein n=1 Tax=Mycena chlorophos TaxID=658473 RepID=A0ABQ0L7K7_MYCCL|nr:predicted protein [Mycena chlorophos]
MQPPGPHPPAVPGHIDNPVTVLSLPSEILAEIFKAYLPPYPACADIKQASKSPLGLGQICRQWRQIAWSTPSLWRAVYIRGHVQNPDTWADLLRAYLDRSGACGLSIQLFVSIDDPSVLTNSRKTIGLLDAFLPYRARWEYLSLDVNAASCALFDGPMPMLKGIELVGWDHDEAMLYPSLPSFSEAPMLCSMSLWDIDLGAVTSPTWNQLTAVHLTETNEQCIPFLQQTPNLRYLCLSFDSREMISTTDQAQAVHLPHCLETLALKSATRMQRQDDDDWTLEMFVVPTRNLRRLQIDARFLRTMDTIPQIGSFCEHSRCRIAEMRVMNFERRFGFDATGEWRWMQDVVESCEIVKDGEEKDEWEAEAIPFATRMY